MSLIYMYRKERVKYFIRKLDTYYNTTKFDNLTLWGGAGLSISLIFYTN